MSISRRSIMKGSLAGGLLIAVAPQSGCAVDPPPVYPAAVEDDPTRSLYYGTIRVRVAEIPELARRGGAVTLHLAALSDPARERPFTMPSPPELLVIHRPTGDGDEAWLAVESSCPHAGCPLGYAAADDQIECPCHRSRFRTAPVAGDVRTCAGQVLRGPARQGPNGYATSFDAATGVLRIDLTVPAGCGTTRLPDVVSGNVTLSLADFPQLATVNGSVIGRPRGLGHDLAIVRVSAAGDASAFTAVNPACTHLGCTVEWRGDGTASEGCGDGSAGGFMCPCHCSEFAADGALIVGPADQPLASYSVTFDGVTLIITV